MKKKNDVQLVFFVVLIALKSLFNYKKQLEIMFELKVMGFLERFITLKALLFGLIKQAKSLSYDGQS